MRDLNRIDNFLKEIGKIWKDRVPDWRFGQLMFNFFSKEGDPFYWEEDAFIEKLKKYLGGEDNV